MVNGVALVVVHLITSTPKAAIAARLGAKPIMIVALFSATRRAFPKAFIIISMLRDGKGHSLGFVEARW